MYLHHNYFFFRLAANLLNVIPMNDPTITRASTNRVAGIEMAYSLGRKNFKMGLHSSRNGCNDEASRTKLTGEDTYRLTTEQKYTHQEQDPSAIVNKY